jgi:hypothetical protein
MPKDTCESSNDLSVFWLRKYGYFRGWKSGGIKWTSGWDNESGVSFTVDTMDALPHVRFSYTLTNRDGEKEAMNYRVELEATSCNLGGKRYWFICPLVRDGVTCRWRVGVLYIVGKYFGCRKCHDLAYRSQQEPSYYRVISKFFGLSDELDKKEWQLRVRFWKGKPTKRYARLLKKTQMASQYSRMAMDELERPTCRHSRKCRKRI